MHHIYHTEGIILGSRNFGDSGRYYHIFTRDLGMIYASAQGVRKLSSKLRFVLQDFSYVKIDLVKGKDFWRVTSASKSGSLEELTKMPDNFQVFANISRLLRRLLVGEYPNKELFTDLVSGLLILEKAKTGGELRNIEAVIVLRILNNLGYIGESLELDTLTKSPFGEELVLQAYKHRREVLSEINKALKETHL